MGKDTKETKRNKNVPLPEFDLKEQETYHVKGTNCMINDAIYTGYSYIGKLVVYHFTKNLTEYKVTEPSIKKDGYVVPAANGPVKNDDGITVVRQHEYPWESKRTLIE